MAFTWRGNVERGERTCDKLNQRVKKTQVVRRVERHPTLLVDLGRDKNDRKVCGTEKKRYILYIVSLY